MNIEKLREKIAEEIYTIGAMERDQFIDEYSIEVRKSRKWEDLPDSPSKEYWRGKADQILLLKEVIDWAKEIEAKTRR